jgi:hypothetical protein
MMSEYRAGSPQSRADTATLCEHHAVRLIEPCRTDAQALEV